MIGVLDTIGVLDPDVDEPESAAPVGGVVLEPVPFDVEGGDVDAVPDPDEPPPPPPPPQPANNKVTINIGETTLHLYLKTVHKCLLNITPPYARWCRISWRLFPLFLMHECDCERKYRSCFYDASRNIFGHNMPYGCFL